ncbi:MAG: CHAT domain-containing protein [Bacteroidia bacterium]|nr:CHAT domain-containing protein [Bacteroidia bacterium]
MKRVAVVVLLGGIILVANAQAQTDEEIYQSAVELEEAGFPDSAAPLYLKAGEEFFKNQDWENALRSFTDCSYCHYQLGDLFPAEKPLEICLNIIDDHFQGNHELAPVVYALLTATKEGLGKYGEALTYGLKALELEKQSPEPDFESIADNYNNLGAICVSKADYDQAIEYFQESIRIDKENNLEVELPSTQNNLGQAYYRKLNYKLAIEEFQKSLLWQRQNAGEKATYVKTLNNLAIVWTDSGEYEMALKILEESLQISEKDAAGRLYTLGNLGYTHLRSGNFEKARFYLNQSLALCLKKFGKVHPETGKIELHLGEAFLKESQRDSALQHFCLGLQAITGTETATCGDQLPDIGRASDRRILFRLLAGSGRALQETNPEMALEYFYLAAREIKGIRSTFFAEESKQFILEHYYPIFEEGINLARQQMERGDKKRAPQIALGIADMSKSVRLLESLNEAALKEELKVPMGLLQQERELEQELEILAKLEYQAQNKGVLSRREELASRAAETKNKLISLEMSISRNYPFLKVMEEDSRQESQIPAEINLPGNTALLEYFWGNNSLNLIKISQEKGVEMFNLNFPDDLGVRIRKFRTLISDFDTYFAHPAEIRKQIIQEGVYLYQILMAPAFENAVPENLILVPDGPILQFPFEALLTQPQIDPSTGFPDLPWLVRSVNISYSLNSGEVFTEKQDLPRSQSPTFTAFAPHVLGPDQGRIVPGAALPAAEQEILALGRQYEGNIYFGKTATKINFLGLSTQSMILHLSTHGVLDPNNGMWSYLQFAQESEADEGKLFAYEVQNTHPGSRLAVLSACETGAGNILRGEGVMSMARGFFQAGVPAVVMSLWKVEDLATADLMAGFYKHLAAGDPTDLALARSQREFLAASDEISAFPGFWAGFVMVGQPQILPAGSGFQVWQMVLTLLVLGGLILGWWRWRRKRKN